MTVLTQFSSFRALLIATVVLVLTAAPATADAAGVSFTGPTNFPGAGGSIVVADFNGDFRSDIATERGAVLLGNGGGGFGAPTYFWAGEGTSAIAAGDFNGDSRADLAITHEYHQDYDAEGSGNVSIHLGNGNGGFAAPTFFGARLVTVPLGIAVGDFNGDSRSDLAVASSSNTVTVGLNDGLGNFTGRNFTTDHGGQAAAAVAVGDLNRDSRPDLVVSGDSSGRFSVLLGIGDGTFAPKASVTVGPVTSLALGDFNGDSRPDVAIVGYSNTDDGSVSVLLGNGSGGFADPVASSAGPAPSSLAVGDLNGDSHLDLAITHFTPGAINANNVSVLLGDGTADFAERTIFPSGPHMGSIAIGHFNPDSRPDLAAVSSSSALTSGVWVFLNANVRVAIDDVSQVEGGTGQTDLTFTVSLDGRSTDPIVVDLKTEDGTATVTDSDYTPLSTRTLTFAPGEGPKTVTVKVTGDTRFEPDEDFKLKLSNPSNALIQDGIGVGVIRNDDSKPPIASFEFAPEAPLSLQRVTFTSTSSDPDGSISEVKWDLDNDGSFDDASTAETSYVFDTSGTKTVRLQVKDNAGNTVTTSRTVAVTNRIPTAAIEAPTAGRKNTSIMFKSLSTDIDGSIAKTEWDIDGDGFDDGTGSQVSWVFSATGPRTIRVRVTDNLGATDDEAHVIEIGGNTSPTAAFNATSMAPLTFTDVSFTSISSDPDGVIAAVDWDLDGDGSFNDGSNSAITRQFLVPGPQVVRLRVTDDDGASAVAEKIVNVGNRAPTAAIEMAPASPSSLEQVTFRSSAADQDGRIASWLWDLDNDGRFEDGSGATAVRSFPRKGTYTVKLRVTDNSGASVTATHVLTVANKLPIAAFTHGPASPKPHDEVALSSTSQDLDGTIQTIQWDTDNDGLFDDGSGLTAKQTYATPGAKTVRLKVMDNDGGEAIGSQSIVIGNSVPATLTARPAKVSRSGSFTLGKLLVECPAGGSGCTVKTSVTRAVAGSAKKKSARLGGSSYRLLAGKHGAVKVKLSKKGLRLLRRSKSIKGSVTIMVIQGGQTTTKNVKVTLKGPKK